MDSALTSVGLPAALAIIMFGLGLSLTVGDFARVAKAPKAVSIALICQLLLLPAAAFGLVTLFDLDPLLAVGMMLLAASPGGTTANLFSHLFRGDVALNVTLTAVNSVIAVVTLPLITNFALGYFEPEDADDTLGLQFTKVLQVFAVVLIPVALGMWVRLRSSAFAERMDKPVRIGSAVVLALVIVGTVVSERENIADYLVDIGVVAALFCLLSLSIGYVVPRIFGIEDRQAIASSMEIGIHNSTLAITIAVSLLGNVQLAVPAAVYGVLMFPLAAAFGATITRKSRTMAEID
ncbi:bile acid:sodium symporter family protein [Rhodococcus erythropolis]|uniref:bile acid:sodium symporter family protein n=1 Tax=Rhodococcus TaxID=1827 RepID=UPI0004C466CF|nr:MULTISPECIES: bile acid:sodium symporter family protein [Rhodococcus]MCJ0945738.1 bile acid:sodium symporter family protein [Rhodococcus sp. ARC_M8]QEX09423.1 bile acid:sodium symporter family protein [Rhodococcus erythropolis]ULD39082.1 bile acid:sodium symporter family protein [Rhodococcus qingshengii]BBE43907.1 transporter [Rhodococcus erythropolis]